MSTGGSPSCFEALAPLHVVRARGPGEVVNVFLVVTVRRRAVRVIDVLALLACRGQRPSSRHGHADVVDAVIGKKLGRSVKLMAIPLAVVLEHADLRKPLAEKKIMAHHTGAFDGARNLRRPGNIEGDRLVRLRPRAGSVTAITVRSSSLPSSGEMKRMDGVRSRPAVSPPVTLKLETSIAAISSASSPGDRTGRRPAAVPS